MRLETKLCISSGILIGAMCLSAYSAHVRLRHADELTASISTGSTPFLLGVREARLKMTLSVRELETALLLPLSGPEAESHTAGRRFLMAQALAAFASLGASAHHVDTSPYQSRLAQIGTGLERLAQFEQQAEMYQLERTPAAQGRAVALLQQEILPLDRSTYDLLCEVAQGNAAHAQDELQQLRDFNRGTNLWLLLTTLLAAVLGGVISLLLARNIAHAIDLVADRANTIAAGDLTGDPLALGRDAGLMTGGQGWTHDQIGTLAFAMEKMQSSLAAIIGTVVQTASTLTGSADSMRSTSDQIHRRIDQQSQQTQQAATAMQEMSASIAEVSRHTQSAADTARSAAQTAHEGGEIVKQMLASMHTIASAVTETSVTVGLLGDDSRRISQIVTVIDEIARKTNLLALNAAIEAARAGDQGRGFAVVAGEVRRLAESTAQATGEIAGMIHAIQDRTRIAIASMESGTETVQQGVVTTNQAGQALERIIGMAERVDRMIAQIAIAASQQAAAADQSSSSLDAIHQLSNENLAEMSTAAVSVERLRTAAQTLERQVERFNVDPFGAVAAGPRLVSMPQRLRKVRHA